jgi:hypothetical protein
MQEKVVNAEWKNKGESMWISLIFSVLEMREIQINTYAFQRPCRLQYSRATTWLAVTGKNACGFSPGFR